MMLVNLLSVMEMVSVAPPFLAAWPTATDTSDEPIWTAAVRSGASFVISHNPRDFPPRNQAGYCAHEGIEYITPENFVSSVLALDLDLVAPLPVLSHHRIRHQRHA